MDGGVRAGARWTVGDEPEREAPGHCACSNSSYGAEVLADGQQGAREEFPQGTNTLQAVA